MDKVLFYLVDGVADVAIPEFGGQTPLQAAHTPTFDAIAALGINGLLDPVHPGLGCGTDTAHLNIFGYDPRVYYRGRGAFESIGAGLEMITGDVAFKANFATWDTASGIVLHRRADRCFEREGPILCQALNNIAIPGFPNHEVAVKYATEHRCGVRIRGPGLTDNVSGTDPLKDNLPLLRSHPLSDVSQARGVPLSSAELTSKLINAVSDAFHTILMHHPINAERKECGKPLANLVLLRGPGMRLEVPAFAARHGCRGFAIAPTAIIRGITTSLGLNCFSVPGATGDTNSNVNAKTRAGARLLRGQRAEAACKDDPDNPADEFSFGFVHVKGIDDAGHDGNVEQKLQLIENADQALCEGILRLFGGLAEGDADGIGPPLRQVNVVVSADHSTPVWRKDHSCEPVPICVAKLCPCTVQHFLEIWQSYGDGAGVSVLPSEVPNEVCDRCQEFPRDDVRCYSEISAVHGSLGRFEGSAVMGLVKDMVNWGTS